MKREYEAIRYDRKQGLIFVPGTCKAGTASKVWSQLESLERKSKDELQRLGWRVRLARQRVEHQFIEPKFFSVNGPEPKSWWHRFVNRFFKIN